MVFKRYLFTFVILLTVQAVQAIDNPDKINQLALFDDAFTKKYSTYEMAQTTTAMLKALDELKTFCERELLKSMSQVEKGLNVKEKKEFQSASLEWESYRKKEFQFISDYYSKKELGSFAQVEKVSALVDILKSRIRFLKRYEQ